MNRVSTIRSIVIAGPPCTGKTSAGGILAQKLDLQFFDLDSCIVESTSRSIPEIFSEMGEAGFRKIESEILHSLLQSGDETVIAVGGGCLLETDNLRIVREKCILVTLTASNEILIERCRILRGSRPLALTDGQFGDLLARRREHYLSLPNIIDTSDLSPEETAIHIMDILKMLKVKTRPQCGSLG